MASLATRLSYGQIKQLWIANGGAPSRADIMAAIAMAESGGNVAAHNPNPPDDSWGLWQINYYGALRQPRTSAYGSPERLAADPNAQARAAIDISNNGQNLQPWSTFTDGAYKKYLSPSTPADPSAPVQSIGLGDLPPGTSGTGTTEQGCLIPLPLNTCLLNQHQGYAALGAIELGVGGLLILGGIAILLTGGIKSGVVSTIARVVR